MIFGKHINKYYLKYGYALLLGALALLMVDYAQLIVPELYRTVINGVNDGYVVVDGAKKAFDMEFLLEGVCKPLIFVILALVTGRFLWRICLFGSAIRVESDIRHEMFDRSKELSHQYYQVNKVGNMMSLYTNDLETVQECFGDGALMAFDAICLGVIAITKMSRMNIGMTLLCIIPLVILLVCSMILSKYLTERWKVRQEAFSNMSDFSQESFSGIAVVKAFVKESKELLSFRKLNKESENANVEYVKLSVLLNNGVTLLVESVVCVILGYGGFLVYKGTFNAGQLVEFIAYFTATIWPIMAISQLVELHARGKASLKRISELLDAEPDVVDSDRVVKLPDDTVLAGDIEFKDLTFRYPDGEFDVLNNVSFKINAGENVGIIGRTGAGKTTIVDLILRTYNVPDNTVFIDGKDINTLPIRIVRKNAAYVPQDNFLFSDKIENNISFATDSSKYSVQEAAELADVHENIVEFEKKYETILGERGVTVSGGQKQRISIARALMKDAPILILDDSVSAVDVKTEKKILESLRNTRKGKTTILIAHRVTTIKDMDKIILVDDGKILAVGTHDELYANCKAYRTTVDLQKLDDEKEAE